jgi:hypothetical protein
MAFPGEERITGSNADFGTEANRFEKLSNARSCEGGNLKVTAA